MYISVNIYISYLYLYYIYKCLFINIYLSYMQISKLIIGLYIYREEYLYRNIYFD